MWVRLGEGGEQATALPTLRLPGPASAARVGRRFLAGRQLPVRPDRRLRAAVKEELLGRRQILGDAIRETRPDLIHVHESHSDAGAVFGRLDQRIPILLTHHSQGVADACGDYDWVGSSSAGDSGRKPWRAGRGWPSARASSTISPIPSTSALIGPRRPRTSSSSAIWTASARAWAC